MGALALVMDKLGLRGFVVVGGCHALAHGVFSRSKLELWEYHTVYLCSQI